MAEVIVQAAGLSKEFVRGQVKVTALENVDLAVPRGDEVVPVVNRLAYGKRNSRSRCVAVLMNILDYLAFIET